MPTPISGSPSFSDNTLPNTFPSKLNCEEGSPKEQNIAHNDDVLAEKVFQYFLNALNYVIFIHYSLFILTYYIYFCEIVINLLHCK